MQCQEPHVRDVSLFPSVPGERYNLALSRDEKSILCSQAPWRRSMPSESLYDRSDRCRKGHHNERSDRTLRTGLLTLRLGARFATSNKNDK